MPVPDRRRRIEAASVPVLRRLAGYPRWLLAGVVGVLLAVALVAGRWWSTLLLVPLLAVLGWLAYLAWPRLRGGERAARLVVLGALTAWLLARVVGGTAI